MPEEHDPAAPTQRIEAGGPDPDMRTSRLAAAAPGPEASGAGAREPAAAGDPVAPDATTGRAAVPLSRLLTRRGGHYLIERELGRGGMGVVYEAFDHDLRRRVAMKVTLTHLDADPELTARFFEEAQATAQLQHPGIVPVYEIGLNDEGKLFFTMKLVKGRTLAEVIAQPRSGQPETAPELTRFRLLELLIEVARTVSYAHQRGVVHRDLKPANVMIGRHGEALVMDWGLAKLVAPAQAGETAPVRVGAPAGGAGAREGARAWTREGVILGTPSYMSPEQAEGNPGGVEPASDIYALGAILYHILTGRAPFYGRSLVEIVTKVLTTDPPRPRSFDRRIPRELEAICVKALAKSPAGRYPSAKAFADDLQAYLEHRPVAAHREGPVGTALRPLRRHRAVAAALAVALVAGLVALSRIEGFRRRAEDEWRRAEMGREAATAALTSAERAHGRIEAERRAADLSTARTFSEMARRAMAGKDVLAAELLFAKSLTLDDRRVTRERLVEARAKGARLLWASPSHARGTVAFGPDGRRVAAGSEDGTIRVWDGLTGKEVASLLGHEGGVPAVAFHPAGRLLASAGWDETVRLWDLATGLQVRRLAGHRGKVWAVCFGADGRRLASSGDDCAVRIWDVETGAPLRTLSGHSGTVYGLCFSPDGRQVASGSWDQTVGVWDLETGRRTLELRSRTGWVFRIAWSPDGRFIASGTDAQRIYVWNAATGEEVLALRGHERAVEDVAFSPDGRLLASASFDQTVRLWDIESGHQALALRAQGDVGQHVGVAFSRNGRWLATAGFDEGVAVWDIERKEEAFALRGHRREIWSVAVSPDGRRVASGSRDETIRMWDSETGAPLRVLRGHEGAVNGLSFSPDGARLASGGEDATVRVWDAATGSEIRTLRGHGAPIDGVRFTPDGRALASASWDGTVRLWDVETGECRRTLLGHAGKVIDVDVSPDGRRLASTSYDHTVRIWDLASGEARVLRGHGHQAEGVSFSPDGARVATGSWDRTVRVWDAATGAELYALAGHAGAVYGVRFSPDGKRIASASEDGTVRLWDAARGREELVLRGHEGEVIAAEFSPDGARLFSASYDQTVWSWSFAAVDRLLAAPPEALLAEAERNTGLRAEGIEPVVTAEDRR